MHTYRPLPGTAWRRAWDVLGANGNMIIKSLINTKFTFKALDAATCPYPTEYCIPFPGITFKEISANYCTFEMAAEVANSIGSSATQAYEQLGMNSLVDGAVENFG